MVKMKTDRPLKFDFGWIGAVPDDTNRSPDWNGHIAWLIYSAQSDRYYTTHLLKCESEAEVAELFRRYAERLRKSGGAPFTPLPEDFARIAKNTWADPDFQEARKIKNTK
jgi:hypothetical protein